MKKLILGTLATLSFFLLIGSVGAYDNNTIGFWQMLIQAGIAVAIECLSLKALNK